MRPAAANGYTVYMDTNSTPEKSGRRRASRAPTFTELAHRRQDEAYALWLAGLPFTVIYRQLHYASPSGAYKAVQASIARRITAPTAERIVLEDDRLDKALAAIWPEVLAGNFDAVDRMLKIGARRSKLLGLDAPKKIDITQQVTEKALKAGLDPEEVLREVADILS